MNHIRLLLCHLHLCDGERAPGEVGNIPGAVLIRECTCRPGMDVTIDTHLVSRALKRLQQVNNRRTVADSGRKRYAGGAYLIPSQSSSRNWKRPISSDRRDITV